jgi:predicted signal transduction protein with EAL and GGDEF domain
VYVESNPGYAYKEFWNIARMMCIWFAIMGLMVAVVGGLGIRYLLKPLNRVEQQAEALSRRQYIIQETIPRTRELRSVVLAMNQMTNKVRSIFEKQAAVAERLQNQAYRDELTGLGNRRYFEGQIKPRLERKDGNIKGALFLVQVHNLQTVNKEKGYQAGDVLVKRTAELLDAVARVRDASRAAAGLGLRPERSAGSCQQRAGDQRLLEPHRARSHDGVHG